MAWMRSGVRAPSGPPVLNFHLRYEFGWYHGKSFRPAGMKGFFVVPGSQVGPLDLPAFLKHTTNVLASCQEKMFDRSPAMVRRGEQRENIHLSYLHCPPANAGGSSASPPGRSSLAPGQRPSLTSAAHATALLPRSTNIHVANTVHFIRALRLRSRSINHLPVGYVTAIMRKLP